MKSNFADLTGKHINWAAGIAWLGTVAACTWLVQSGRTQIFFVSLPGWFVTCLVYIALSKLQQGTRPVLKGSGL
jgi:hypothetical protein